LRGLGRVTWCIVLDESLLLRVEIR
jgi:hypothetical protein